VACKSDSTPKGEESDSTHDLEDEVEWTFFSDWWSKNMEKTSPRNKRRVVYTGKSDRTIRRKHAENCHALKTCPMKDISSYFTSDQPQPNAQQDQPSHADGYTIQNLSPALCISKLEDLYNKGKAFQVASFIQICVLLKFF
jgi:hypothetical protein